MMIHDASHLTVDRQHCSQREHAEPCRRHSSSIYLFNMKFVHEVHV